MPSHEDIRHQYTLLGTHRQTLRIHLQKLAIFTEAYAPPDVSFGIADSRKQIQRVKQILRKWGQQVEDHPDDGDELFATDPSAQPTSAPLNQGGGQPQPPVAYERSVLRKWLTDYFNDEELHDLSFDLQIDYESLPGSGKSGRARELVAYAERHSRLSDLVALMKRLRPQIPW